jgi:hypothetical protein
MTVTTPRPVVANNPLRQTAIEIAGWLLFNRQNVVSDLAMWDADAFGEAVNSGNICWFSSRDAHVCALPAAMTALERRALELVAAQSTSATSFNVEVPPSNRHLVLQACR